MPNENTLADVPIINTSPTVTPEDFDLVGFIAGVRPTRRSVQIFAQGHLISRLEQLAVQIQAAAEGVDVDDLIDEFEQTRDQFHAGVWFEIEKRSSEWVEKFRADKVKELGLVKKPRVGGGKPELDPKDTTTVTLHQVAEQIVTPAGMTYPLLMQMVEGNEGEVAKLMTCMSVANNDLAESAEVLTRDFSAKRSTKNETPDS